MQYILELNFCLRPDDATYNDVDYDSEEEAEDPMDDLDGHDPRRMSHYHPI